MKKLLFTFLLCLILTTSAFGQFFAPQQKPMLGLQVNWAHPLSKGLVFFPPFNEGSGGQVFDLSGNNNKGILQGGDVVWSPGKFGSSLSFPGTDGDYIDCGTGIGNILGTTTNISICLWFKTDTSSANDGIFYIGDLSNSNGELALHIHTNVISFKMDNQNFDQDITFTDTTSWHHLCVTYDGVRGKAYLDNVLVVDEAYTAALSLSGLKTIIGAYYSSPFTFDGQIDHVMVYNRALSAFEIALLYREPFCMFEPSWNYMLYGAISAPPSVSIPVFMYHYMNH